MASRKRKAKEPEDEPPAKQHPAKRSSAKPCPAERSSAPRAARKRDDPDWCVTNKKSPLAEEDLHAKYSDPETYEDYTKEDWEALHEYLPPNVRFNSDGYSVPLEFFKYDPDWRRGIREFQEDLASGRLEPEWQEEAAEAMEERARGDFDQYKEDQYEEFWGQKQKLRHGALAGESTNLKLDVLIQNGLFKVGDYFDYHRAFGRAKSERILIEKEAKLVKIHGDTLTFAIPPGRLKYARRLPPNSRAANTTSKLDAVSPQHDDTVDEPSKESVEAVPQDTNSSLEPVKSSTEGETREIDEGSNPTKNGVLRTNSETSMDEADAKKPIIEPTVDKDVPNINREARELKAKDQTPNRKSTLTGDSIEIDGNSSRAETEVEHLTHEPTTPENRVSAINHGALGSVKDFKNSVDNEAAPRSEPKSTANNFTNSIPQKLEQSEQALGKASEDLQEDVMLYNITTLRQLEKNFIEVDGRVRDLPAVNSWKAMRCKRNNQDLGTLFEMRENYYVYKSPEILKTPKKRK